MMGTGYGRTDSSPGDRAASVQAISPDPARSMHSQSYTGRERRRTTRWTVHVADRVARWLIVAGGIGTILAVSVVCIFLVWVVVRYSCRPRSRPNRSRRPSGLPTRSAARRLGPRPIARLGTGSRRIADLRSAPDNGELVARQPLLSETHPRRRPSLVTRASAPPLDSPMATCGWRI